MPLIGFALSLPSPLRSAVAGEFSPADLSPALWLDASDATTITESGGAVSQWDNKGSLGDFTQGTASLQPTTGASILKSKNVIDFAGDVLNTSDANSAWNALHDGTEYIVAAVAKFGTTSNPDDLYPLLGSVVGSAQHGATIFYDDRSGVSRNNAMLHYVTRGSSPLTANNISANDVISPNTFSVVSAFADLDNGTAADRSKMYVDGGAAIANNADAGTPSSSDATYPLQIGGAQNGTYVLTGSIAEIVVVTGANATEANRSELVTYLTNKWIPIPIQLNATAWFDASNSFSITESSGSVSQWDDLSGNGYHLTQGTSQYQPKTGTATMNSLNVIEYDTTSGQQFLSNSSVPTTTNKTMLAVYEINALDDVYVAMAGIDAAKYMYAAGDGNTSTTLHAGATATSLYVNNTEFTGTTRDNVYDAVGNSPAIVRVTGQFSGSGLAMGYAATSGVSTFDNGSKVAEIVVLDNPAPADVVTAESYLAEKWGITLQEFSPADLSPTLWLDASDTGTITESGGSVSQWDDKSGNGNDLTQGTGSLQPTTGAATINGLNVISYDNDSMLSPSIAFTGLTMIAVYRHSSEDFILLGTNSNGVYAGVGQSGSTSTNLTGGMGTMSLRFNSTPFSGTDRNDVYTEFASSTKVVTVEVDGTFTRPLAPYSYTSDAFRPVGDIAEIIVVDGTLTAQQIYDTEQYLANKWGITLS